jgi:DNA-binding transcriptional LysR family regulator
MVALASAGLGIGVTALGVVPRELALGTLVQVLPDWTLPSIDLHAVYAPGRVVSRAARSLVDYLAASFAAETANGRAGR